MFALAFILSIVTLLISVPIFLVFGLGSSIAAIWGLNLPWSTLIQMAFEAMNTAGDYGKDLIAVLNDNQMSISATVGAFSKYFSRLTASPTYNVLRTKFKEFLSHVPTDARQVVKRLEVATKPGMLFEEFGFRYFGPIDGHDIDY